MGQLNTDMFNDFKAPRQFFAPVVDSKQFNNKIIDYSVVRKQSATYEPIYANFAYIIMYMSSCIRSFAK